VQNDKVFCVGAEPGIFIWGAKIKLSYFIYICISWPTHHCNNEF